MGLIRLYPTEMLTGPQACKFEVVVPATTEPSAEIAVMYPSTDTLVSPQGRHAPEPWGPEHDHDCCALDVSEINNAARTHKRTQASVCDAQPFPNIFVLHNA